jgi:hypothetical protein
MYTSVKFKKLEIEHCKAKISTEGTVGRFPNGEKRNWGEF